MIRSLTFALAALLVATFGSAHAQPSFTATLGQGLDALQPAGAETDAQRNLAAGGTAEILFHQGRARVFYDVGVTDYATPGDWRSVVHEAGARYRVDLGAAARRLFVGGSVVVRRNGDSWDAADYNAIGAFGNLEWQPRETATLRAGYRFDARRFPTYAAMDQQQHSAFASALVNLPSRTTLIAEASAGTKRYDSVPSSSALVAMHAATGPSPMNGAGSGTGAGAGQGGTGAGSLGSQRGWASLDVPVTVPGSPASHAQQVTLFGRVAQSLADRTSLIGEVSVRHAFGEVPAAVITTPARFFDDGVYDDPFASDSRLGRLGLKSIVRGVEINGWGSWQVKPYGATPALDGSGAAIAGVLREDTVTRAAVLTIWPVFPSRIGRVDLDLLAGYDYTRHRSTTAVYNYTSHAISVGAQVGY